MGTVETLDGTPPVLTVGDLTATEAAIAADPDGARRAAAIALQPGRRATARTMRVYYGQPGSNDARISEPRPPRERRIGITASARFRRAAVPSVKRTKAGIGPLLAAIGLTGPRTLKCRFHCRDFVR